MNVRKAEKLIQLIVEIHPARTMWWGMVKVDIVVDAVSLLRWVDWHLIISFLTNVAGREIAS